MTSVGVHCDVANKLSRDGQRRPALSPHCFNDETNMFIVHQVKGVRCCAILPALLSLLTRDIPVSSPICILCAGINRRGFDQSCRWLSMGGGRPDNLLGGCLSVGWFCL